MSNPGYLIARNRAEDSFFTSASSYDRPRWTPLKESKVYATAELADAATKKLMRHGAYEVRIVSLAEAMSFEFPDAADKTATLPNQEQDKKNGMVANDQEETCPSCDRCPCECHEGDDPDSENSADLEAVVDDAAGISPEGRNTEAGEDLAKRLSAGKGGLGESATMPAKPPLDAKPDENDKTVVDVKPVEKIKYSNPSTVSDDEDTKMFQTGALPNDAKVKVPSEVMADLSAAIATFDECAEFSKSQNDDKASFCMTTAEAFKSIQQDLKLGTVAGVKAAQIKVTSWMNPITSHLPVSVQKFIYMGGRKPSLLDMFDQKRLTKAK